MKGLEKYTYKRMVLNGLDTYIISPEHYDEFLRDEKLMESLQILKEFLYRYISIAASETGEALYFAIGYNQHIKRKWPLLCLEQDGVFYHVSYHSGWICRQCMQDNGAVIMPLVEAAQDYYIGLNPFEIPIPSIFQNVACKSCGHMLQGHLIKLDKKAQLKK